ncbi:glutaredoxin family protein [Microbacterium sp. A588]
MTTVTIIGRPGCHLCPTAREIVETVVADLPDEVGDRIEIVEKSIDEDAALYELWWEKIPVVLINDEFHAQWRVSPELLRQRLETQ